MTTFQKLIILLFAFLIAGWFYWFQYRPSEIKIACQEEADSLYAKLATSEDTDGDGLIPRSSIKIYKERSESEYKSCLHSKGL